MTRSNLVYKIRDNATGLFWGGKNGCDAKIGTRFATRSSLDGTVTTIIAKKKGWPESWEVLRVELGETVLETISARSVVIDTAMSLGQDHLRKIFLERGARDPGDGQKAFRELWRLHTLKNWAFIAERNARYNYRDFRREMISIGVKDTRFANCQNGWCVFTDAEAATMAKMKEQVRHFFSIDDIRHSLANRLGVSVDDLL